MDDTFKRAIRIRVLARVAVMDRKMFSAERKMTMLVGTAFRLHGFVAFNVRFDVLFAIVVKLRESFVLSKNFGCFSMDS